MNIRDVKRLEIFSPRHSMHLKFSTSRLSYLISASHLREQNVLGI